MRIAESPQLETATSGKPLLIYDGNCGFCKLWIARWKRMTGGRIAYGPSQDVGARYPQITREQFAKAPRRYSQ
jgi:predicted DCC family thiol-disulfide oxidoreductase YuxK